MEPISMAIGAALLIAGSAGGFTAGRRQRHNPKAICEGCAHGLSYHDSGGLCHATHQQAEWADGSLNRYIYVQCTCQQYVGPVPADRMLASFTLPPALPGESTRYR